jgi:hypothetical protein
VFAVTLLAKAAPISSLDWDTSVSRVAWLLAEFSSLSVLELRAPVYYWLLTGDCPWFLPCMPHDIEVSLRESKRKRERERERLYS